MKKTVCAMVCTLALGLTATNARADVILAVNDPYYVGLISPDGGSPTSEIGYISALIAATSAGTWTAEGQTFTRSANLLPPFVLPDPTTLLFTKEDSDLTGPFLVQGYILGKYDNQEAGAYVWYLGTPEVVQLPASLGDCGNGPGCGLSHTIYNASAVPDGGMTLMLLGGVLVGLEALRRRLRG